MLRLFVEQEANQPAFHALTRFLDLLDDVETALPAQPALDPLVLSFQLKLVWLSGYLPHLAGCASCGEELPLVAFSARGAGVSARAARRERCGSPPRGSKGSVRCSSTRSRMPRGAGLGVDALRQCLRVIEATYEEHGGFRLRTLAQTR